MNYEQLLSNEYLLNHHLDEDIRIKEWDMINSTTGEYRIWRSDRMSETIVDVFTYPCLNQYNLYQHKGPVQDMWRCMLSLLVRFMGPTWGPPGPCRPQMGPMLAPWTFLSGELTLMLSYARQYHLGDSHVQSPRWPHPKLRWPRPKWR